MKPPEHWAFNSRRDRGQSLIQMPWHPSIITTGALLLLGSIHHLMLDYDGSVVGVPRTHAYFDTLGADVRSLFSPSLYVFPSTPLRQLGFWAGQLVVHHVFFAWCLDPSVVSLEVLSANRWTVTFGPVSLSVNLRGSGKKGNNEATFATWITARVGHQAFDATGFGFLLPSQCPGWLGLAASVLEAQSPCSVVQINVCRTSAYFQIGFGEIFRFPNFSLPWRSDLLHSEASLLLRSTGRAELAPPVPWPELSMQGKWKRADSEPWWMILFVAFFDCRFGTTRLDSSLPLFDWISSGTRKVIEFPFPSFHSWLKHDPDWKILKQREQQRRLHTIHSWGIEASQPDAQLSAILTNRFQKVAGQIDRESKARTALLTPPVSQPSFSHTQTTPLPRKDPRVRQTRETGPGLATLTKRSWRPWCLWLWRDWELSSSGGPDT